MEEKSENLPKLRPGGKPRVNKKLQGYLIAGESRYQPLKDRETIDLDAIRAMASIGCTKEEMAALLRCSVAWVNQQASDNAAFAIAIENGYAEMKQSLRRTQLAMAMSGSVPLLIWLGKQYLGQSDKQEIENKTQISITVQRAMDELRNIPKDQLLAAQALLAAPVLAGQAVEISVENQELDPPTPLSQKQESQV